MQRHLPVLGVILSLACAAHGQNLIINGSFETNSAAGDMSNMSNATFTATVANATAFGGSNEIDLYTTPPYGLPAVHGDWKIALHRQTSGAVDAFSFDLTGGIVAGNTYTIDFWAHAETTFDSGNQPVEIGISSAANTFGTLVYTSGALSSGSWTNYVSNFVAPVNASYVTVRNANLAPNTWAHVDDFSLTLVPAPGSLALLAGGGVLAVRRRRLV